MLVPNTNTYLLTYSEWDPDATDAETDVDTDNTEDRASVPRA